MRVLVTLLALATLSLGVHAFADEDTAAPTTDRTSLKVEKRLKLLELEVEYLRLREERMSAYMLANRNRGEGLDALAKRVRELGFETARIQISSRRALLSGLEAMAVAMATDLPEPTPEEAVLLKQIGALSE